MQVLRISSDTDTSLYLSPDPASDSATNDQAAGDPSSADDEPLSPPLNDAESLSKGEVKTDKNKEKEFTILLVGETGVGKTSVLSLIANVLMGNRPPDYKVFYDQDNEAGGSDKHSQINTAQVYELRSVNGVKVCVLDSPGLADMRSIEWDELHKKSIAEAIQSSIVTVNAVLILANGTIPCLTTGTDYALSTLSAIFPCMLAENISFLFTNVSSPLSWNFDPSSLPDILQGNMQFLLDNPIAMQKKYLEMKKNPKISEKTKKQLYQAVLSGEQKALDMLVEMFDWLDGLKLQLMTDILSLYDQSQQIETKITNTLAIMRQAADSDKELDKVQRELDGAQVNMNMYRKYENVVNRKDWYQKSMDCHNTVCSIPDCYFNCHVSCGLNFTLNPDELRDCTVMVSSGGVCCEKCKHGQEFHQHYNSIWDIKEVSELKINEEAKAKFEKAQSDKERAEQLRKEIRDAKSKLQNRIMEAIKDLGRLIEHYSKLSLSGSFAGQVEKAVKMLEQNLETMRESGAAKKMIDKVEASLKSMQNKLEVLKKAKRDKEANTSTMSIAKNKFKAFFF